MMGLEVIVALNQEIAERAARRNVQPVVISDPDDVDLSLLPNIGYLELSEWEKTESWFVDKTGHGYESESALTHKSFLEELREFVFAHPGHGYAITEEGEFQVVVSAFERSGE
jgi:hypothetical protein